MKTNKNKVIICCCVIVSAFTLLFCKYYDRVPNYTYGEDYYYTLLVDDITEKYPGFIEANSEEKLGILRNYVYSNTLHAKNGDVYLDVWDERLISEYFSQYVYNLLNTYNNGKPIGGYYCGGTNWTLARLYNLMGYDAVTLDMAVLDNVGGGWLSLM